MDSELITNTDTQEEITDIDNTLENHNQEFINISNKLSSLNNNQLHINGEIDTLHFRTESLERRELWNKINTGIIFAATSAVCLTTAFLSVYPKDLDNLKAENLRLISRFENQLNDLKTYQEAQLNEQKETLTQIKQETEEQLKNIKEEQTMQLDRIYQMYKDALEKIDENTKTYLNGLLQSQSQHQNFINEQMRQQTEQINNINQINQMLLRDWSQTHQNLADEKTKIYQLLDIYTKNIQNNGESLNNEITNNLINAQTQLNKQFASWSATMNKAFNQQTNDIYAVLLNVIQAIQHHQQIPTLYLDTSTVTRPQIEVSTIPSVIITTEVTNNEFGTDLLSSIDWSLLGTDMKNYNFTSKHPHFYSAQERAQALGTVDIIEV